MQVSFFSQSSVTVKIKDGSSDIRRDNTKHSLAKITEIAFVLHGKKISLLSNWKKKNLEKKKIFITQHDLLLAKVNVVKEGGGANFL